METGSAKQQAAPVTVKKEPAVVKQEPDQANKQEVEEQEQEQEPQKKADAALLLTARATPSGSADLRRQPNQTASRKRKRPGKEAHNRRTGARVAVRAAPRFSGAPHCAGILLTAARTTARTGAAAAAASAAAARALIQATSP